MNNQFTEAEMRAIIQVRNQSLYEHLGSLQEANTEQNNPEHHKVS